MLAFSLGLLRGLGSARLATLLFAVSLPACSDKQGSEDGDEAGAGGTGAGGMAGSGGKGQGGTNNAGSSAGGSGNAGTGGSSGGTAGTAGGGRGGSAGTPTGGSGGGAGSSGALPWLRVTGNRIEDPAGNQVVLRGVSFIDLGATEEWEAAPDK